MEYKNLPKKTNKIARLIVDAAYAVHTTLGPGLLESVYEICLIYELKKRKLKVKSQVDLPVIYKRIHLNAGLRLDLVVEDCVVIEIKSVKNVLPLHKSQLLTYLKLTGYRLGFLINFNVPVIKDGIKRMIL